MRNRVVLTLALVATTALLAPVCSVPLRAQDSGGESDSALSTRHALITQAVDEAQLTTLRGNTHPLARPQFDLGTAPASLPMERMLLVLKRSPEQETALRKLLDDQQDKKSANYHKWLTPEQFGKQFGPSDADLQTITSWLQSHGFQVSPTKGRTVMEFSGSASQVQEAFHTSIHKYIANGEQHWANASDPRIPTALTPAVAGVSTLHNFIKKPTYRLAKEKGVIKPGKPPQVTFTDGSHGLAPGDYAVIYNINPVYSMPIDGTGITIGVIGRSDIQISDITDFQTLFALSSQVPTMVLNGPDPGDIPGDDVEGTLDATWSQAIAPGATVDFVVSASTNTTDGIDLSELYIIENNLANVMTESFSGCEAGASDAQVAATSALAEQAAAQGITYMVSTGDEGAEGCDDANTETMATGPISVNLLASTPFTVAVGGTVFNENGKDATYWNSTNGADGTSAKSYIPEDVWNDSCTSTSCGTNANIAAGGGGVSMGNSASGNGTFTGFPKPSWQTGVTGIPTGGKRDLPDVSLTASIHDGYALCFQGSCANSQIFVIGGTSASAPSFAGIMALVDEKMGQTPSGPRQGQADYVLYSLAASQNANLSKCNGSSTTTPPLLATCIFNDITVGNNEVPGEPGYPSAPYNSTIGYDPATGLGSVNVANLVTGWATTTFNATTTSLTLNGVTTPIIITHGSPLVNVGIGVTASSGTPMGDVSLIAAAGPGGQTSVPLFTGLGGQQVFTLSGGALAASTGGLPGSPVVAGTHIPYAVTAHYAGIATGSPATTFAPSDSNQVMVTVNPENSTTTETAVAFDQNGNSIPLTSIPFGSLVFVRADVAGASGQGVPTGSVTFTDTFGNLPGQIFNPVTNPAPLNSQGNTSIGAGVINFDAGNHTISAAYGGDPSFNSSSSTSSVKFTIQPGFAGVSGPTDVTIASPGLSGTTMIGIIATTKFGAVTFTCSGLPIEAACGAASATGQGPNTIVNANITVTTMGPHTTMLQPNERPYYVAAALGGGLPLGGILLITVPRRRRWSTLLGLIALALLVTVPACGGGGHASTTHQPDPGTPAGTFTVTVTASAAGVPSQQGTFTLTIQ